MRAPTSSFLRMVGGSALLLRGAGPGLHPECARGARAQQDQQHPDPQTRFILITGDASTNTEDQFQLPQSSPFVLATPFIQWNLDTGPPATASAPRSKVVCTLLQGTTRPTLEESAALAEMPFISHEITPDEAAKWALTLKDTKAFDVVYPRFADWGRKAQSFKPNPNPNPNRVAQVAQRCSYFLYLNRKNKEWHHPPLLRGWEF